MNNHFSGFAGEILSNSRNIPSSMSLKSGLSGEGEGVWSV